MQHSNRTTRFQGRDALRRITTVERCYDCGFATLGAGVSIRQTEEAAGYAGLASCGRVWLCPVCNAKIMARRAVEVGAALTWATVEGLHIIWGSLTMRHNASTDLGWMFDVQRNAWRYVVSSKMWRSQSATLTVDHIHDGCSPDCDRKRDTLDSGSTGRVGYIRAAELTTGDNGWHPHFHPIIVYRGTRAQAQKFADDVVAQWVHGVERQGAEARIAGSQLLEVLDPDQAFEQLAGYVTKSTYDTHRLALETVWSQGKSGRRRAKSTSAHWSVLADVDDGDADQIERWLDLEENVHGHRMIMWSRGLRAFAGLSAEKEDEEIAAEELGTAEDTVCFLTGDGWRRLRCDPVLMGMILDSLESSGWHVARAVMDAHGVEYFQLETAPA